MGIMQKTLRSLLPKGHPWRLNGTFGAVVDALSLSLDRLRTFLWSVIDESNPGTAEDTLREWYAQLGLKYDPTATLKNRQDRARVAQTSIGGQSKDYIEVQLQRAYPNVFLDEVEVDFSMQAGAGVAGVLVASDYPSWVPTGDLDSGEWHVFYYQVRGEVQTPLELTAITDLLDRIAPAYLEPVFNVDILSITGTAQAGLASTGIMRSGKE